MKPNITHDGSKSKSVCGEQEGDSTHYKVMKGFIH